MFKFLIIYGLRRILWSTFKGTWVFMPVRFNLGDLCLWSFISLRTICSRSRFEFRRFIRVDFEIMFRKCIVCRCFMIVFTYTERSLNVLLNDIVL